MTDPLLRIGHAERSHARDLLYTHGAAGRLTDVEITERLVGVEAARTRGDLDRVFADLPGGFTAPTQPPWPTLPTGPSGVSDAGPAAADVLEGTVTQGDVQPYDDPSSDPFAEYQPGRPHVEIITGTFGPGGFHVTRSNRPASAAAAGLLPLIMGGSILAMVLLPGYVGFGTLLFTLFVLAPLINWIASR